MVPGWMQIGLIILLGILLFGRGRISELMADIANGVKSFKKGVSDEEELKANNDSKTIEYIDTSKTKIHTEV